MLIPALLNELIENIRFSEICAEKTAATRSAYTRVVVNKIFLNFELDSLKLALKRNIYARIDEKQVLQLQLTS